jgi:stearoyl-CoA desaturase (delta-9 desaturase)
MIALVVAHWFASLAMQTLYQHRYAAHRMFILGPRTEKVFHLLAILLQGPSHLEPRAYAILHRLHHAHSDTERDPHSPVRHRSVLGMMAETLVAYRRAKSRLDPAMERLAADTPEWPAVDRLADTWAFRITLGAAWAGVYALWAPSPAWLLLLPLHWLMGPVHGAIVNWAGHKYGYVNHPETRDHSRNTLPVDLLMMGELYQNNHHHSPNRADFAHRPFEWDPGHGLLRLLAALGVVRVRGSEPRSGA